MDQIYKRIGQNIRLAREEKEWSQKHLGYLLNPSKPFDDSTVWSWENGTRRINLEQLIDLSRVFGCPLAELLNITIDHEYGDLKWVVSIPHELPQNQKKIIEDGVELFEELIVEGHRFDEVWRNRFGNYTYGPLIGTFTAAVRSGAFRITHVGRAIELEEEIKKKYANFGLKEVMIASVSREATSVIRSEFVAFLAANSVLANFLHTPRGVGIGSGYTIARMAELSMPLITEFSGTKWIPLVSYPEENNVIQAANYIALVLANRHMQSNALFLPYPSEEQDNRKRIDEVMGLSEQLEVAFITVNGYGRSTSSSDGRVFRNKTVTREIDRQNLSDQVAGEILGLFLDDNGSLIGEEDIHNLIRKETFQINLNLMRDIATRGNVWLVAAERYKARAVAMAVKNGLVNSLVIDDEIAKYLYGNN